jgi:hypothetical protein
MWQLAQVTPIDCRLGERAMGGPITGVLISGKSNASEKWLTLQTCPPFSYFRARMGHGSTPARWCAVALVDMSVGSTNGLSFMDKNLAVPQELGHWPFFELVLSIALRRVFASFTASSFAQMCM